MLYRGTFFTEFVVAVLLCTCVLNARAVSDEPRTLAICQVGDFAQGHSWYLSVNSAGQAELVITSRREWIRRKFEVDPKELATLSAALDREGFFNLAHSYGEEVPDGSVRTVTITQGSRSKTVDIKYLMNLIKNDRAALQEAARILRIFNLIRGWFDDTAAADLRPFDEQVLHAAQ